MLCLILILTGHLAGGSSIATVSELRRLQTPGIVAVATELVQFDTRLARITKLIRTADFDEAAEEVKVLWSVLLSTSDDCFDQLAKMRRDDSHRELIAQVLAEELAGVTERLLWAKPSTAAVFQRLVDEVIPNINSTSKVLAFTALAVASQRQESAVVLYQKIRGTELGASIRALKPEKLIRSCLDRRQWADAIEITGNPVERVRRQLELIEKARRLKQPVLWNAEWSGLWRIPMQLYVACLATSREVEALNISAMIFRSVELESADAGARVRVALAKKSFDEGQPRRDHLGWLCEARARGLQNEDLEKRIEVATDSSTGIQGGAGTVPGE